jgi:putative transposase
MNMSRVMSRYKRFYQKGGCYFFTVVTYERRNIFASAANIQRLRAALRHVMSRRPFDIEAVVILPDHLHCVWLLPEEDADFSTRWRLIKHHFSTNIKLPVNRRREKKVWQRRFWEHLIRDENDLHRHYDYIHYNPVKHGYVERPGDWPHSSFLKEVKRGWYTEDWGKQEPDTIKLLDFE